LAVAEHVGKRRPAGVAAYKPANSHPEKERCVFDFVGMMGVPLVPCHEFPAGAPAGFFSVHAMKDPKIAERLAEFIAAGKPVLVSDGLAAKLAGKVDLKASNVRVLAVKGDPKSLLKLSQPDLDAIRLPLLQPLGRRFESPNRVGLYLLDDESWVVENFNDQPVSVQLNGKLLTIPARGWRHEWR
jgi:hypothetical protein